MRPKYDLIIFDLDGTLIDSRLDLANSVNFTRTQLGLPRLSRQVILSYIGDGAAELIRRIAGEELSEARVRQAVEVFLGHYHDHLLDNTVLYPGVLEALAGLHSQVLAILTNKPLEPARAILQGLKIHDRFGIVYGGNSFEQKKPHPAGIERILKETRIPRERALIVGDSRVDVQTGLNAHIATCGVTYGFASDGLAECRPSFLIGNLRELPSIVFG